MEREFTDDPTPHLLKNQTFMRRWNRFWKHPLLYFFALSVGAEATFLQVGSWKIRNNPQLRSSRMTNSVGTEEMLQPSEPVWCEEQQIYIGGVVPEHVQVASWLEKNGGYLRLFGYGSLCWNPGDGTALSKPSVTSTLGRAKGYRRCWAQRSTDHRGTPRFPGIVCTILRDDEVQAIRQQFCPDDYSKSSRDDPASPTLTEGVLYTVPPELAQECLAELDFREKGGYARDIIEVEETETGRTVQALLYRGTPDNPAFWPRALLDLPFAAAVMSMAVGPSGKNDDYLNQLAHFLTDATSGQSLDDHMGDTDTLVLARMTRTLLHVYKPYFLFGCGSNQHNQLLLASDNNAAGLMENENAYRLSEIMLYVPRDHSIDFDQPKQIAAGGGHSAFLTESGRLFLWGWNEHGQLGTSDSKMVLPPDSPLPLPVVSPLQDLLVEKVALGFSHTLVIEKETGFLYALGSNERGQVNGTPSNFSIDSPQQLLSSATDKFVDVAAGLFHSAAISAEGELITFGCRRFGQSLSLKNEPIVRWKPQDGAKLVQVACGRHHTVVVDERGRVWTFGENKYGQLGRKIQGKFDPIPALVDFISAEVPDPFCCEVVSGWSHTIAKVQSGEGAHRYYGWGRNDKAQLGLGGGSFTEHVAYSPVRLFECISNIESVVCGSESTMLCQDDGSIWGCGWNEHGNLSLGSDQDAQQMTKISGAKITSPPPHQISKLKIAAGGAHFLAMFVQI